MMHSSADVVVVEHRVAPGLLDEQVDVRRVLALPQLLHDDGPLEAGLADERALVDAAHAAGAQLLHDGVLGAGGHRGP
jgi:hypothetical protein